MTWKAPFAYKEPSLAVSGMVKSATYSGPRSAAPERDPAPLARPSSGLAKIRAAVDDDDELPTFRRLREVMGSAGRFTENRERSGRAALAAAVMDMLVRRRLG